MEYCTVTQEKLYKKEKGNNVGHPKNLFFLEKILKSPGRASKAHHLHIIVGGKANAINDHGTKSHIAASQC